MDGQANNKEENSSEKHAIYLKKLLKKVPCPPQYQCTGNKCSFKTEDSEVFLQHLVGQHNEILSFAAFVTTDHFLAKIIKTTSEDMKRN